MLVWRKQDSLLVPAGAAGEFSSLESDLCADSYSVSVPSTCYRSGTYKTSF